MGLSKKQAQILTFPKSKYLALICDGAVRSGKTSIMALAFVLWLTHDFNQKNFAICGKSVQSAVRNVIQPLLAVRYLPQHGFGLRYSVSNHLLTVTRGKTVNYIYVFGGKDESSAALIQGITLAGVLLDEVALMPQSFVNQALARCSVEGARFWFNCNPDNPQHWFYQDWILKHKEKNARYLHFLMTDNPSLSKETLTRYEALYSGVFYDRYVRGRWVVAEGLIYPMFHADYHVKPTEPRPYDTYMISCDYGTLNPTSMGLWGRSNGVWYRVKEYYHDGRKDGSRTDEEHYEALENLAAGKPIESVIVDPSAASFIETIERHGRFYVSRAENAVVDGIRVTQTALKSGKLFFNDCCEDCIREFGLYRWDEKWPEDRPMKENDHAMDDVRYFCMDAFAHENPGAVWIGGF